MVSYYFCLESWITAGQKQIQKDPNLVWPMNRSRQSELTNTNVQLRHLASGSCCIMMLPSHYLQILLKCCNHAIVSPFCQYFTVSHQIWSDLLRIGQIWSDSDWFWSDLVRIQSDLSRFWLVLLRPSKKLSKKFISILYKTKNTKKETILIWQLTKKEIFKWGGNIQREWVAKVATEHHNGGGILQTWKRDHWVAFSCLG